MLYDATRLVRGKGVATTLEMHVRKRRLFVRPDSRSMPRSLRVVDHTNHQQPLYHTRTEPENKGKLNEDSFVKHINLTNNQRVKIRRQTNARTVPAENTGYFVSKVLSRQHAEIWEENGKVCCICSVPLFGYMILSCAQPAFVIYFVSRCPMPFIF